MSWIDEKYANLVSVKLPLFGVTKTNPYQANFRCILCGDSKKSPSKCRGYFISKKDSIIYHCHNCGAHLWLSQFLKQVDHELYRQFMMEKYVDLNAKAKYHGEPDNPNNDFKKPKFITESPLKDLKKISQLSPFHPAKKYVLKRKIPNPYHAKLFYTPTFFAWVNSIVPDKFEIFVDEPRLVIPFINKEQQLIGFQGRSFNPKSKSKYFTIVLDFQAPKLYNLDTVDFSKKVYCFEGPLDAMMIPNSIAMGGADVVLRGIEIVPENIVMVFDNEPRSKEITRRVNKSIEEGYQVFIWPNSVNQKDINEMVMDGISPIEIQKMIDTNSFSGFTAKVKLSEWKKC
jgi:hypothetical protein